VLLYMISSMSLGRSWLRRLKAIASVVFLITLIALIGTALGSSRDEIGLRTTRPIAMVRRLGLANGCVVAYCRTWKGQGVLSIVVNLARNVWARQTRGHAI
jgi:hypothetical protein